MVGVRDRVRDRVRIRVRVRVYDLLLSTSLGNKGYQPWHQGHPAVLASKRKRTLEPAAEQ